MDDCRFTHACAVCGSREHGSRSAEACEEAALANKKIRDENPPSTRECKSFARGQECAEGDACEFMHACKFCKSPEHGSITANACKDAKIHKRNRKNANKAKSTL